MNCPSCGAPMRLKPDMASFKCEYCLSVYLPEINVDDGVRVLDEPSGQDCPICNTGLVHATVNTIRICYCKKCHGMLVPMEVLQSLVQELQTDKRAATIQPPADATDLRRKINCPQCHRRMDAHFYAGPGNVVIDSCENCSLIWLDRGELMRIVRAPEEHFATTETFLASPAMGPTRGGDILANTAADVALNLIDPMFRG
ncbi:MAG: zf-TFIIB domain-containing protein [Terracidiphilus sp.]